jgi:chromosome segregation ATPase
MQAGHLWAALGDVNRAEERFGRLGYRSMIPDCLRGEIHGVRAARSLEQAKEKLSEAMAARDHQAKEPEAQPEPAKPGLEHVKAEREQARREACQLRGTLSRVAQAVQHSMDSLDMSVQSYTRAIGRSPDSCIPCKERQPYKARESTRAKRAKLHEFLSAVKTARDRIGEKIAKKDEVPGDVEEALKNVEEALKHVN